MCIVPFVKVLDELTLAVKHLEERRTEVQILRKQIGMVMLSGVVWMFKQ